MTNAPDEMKSPDDQEQQDQKVKEIPKNIQAAVKKKLEVVKTSAQQKYQQILDKASETVDHIDTWAVDQINENLDKVTENIDRSRQETQVKLQKGVKQTQTTIQKQAKQTGDRLKNAAQSLLKKVKDRL
jgi:flavin-binding protein dodecin